MNIAMAIGMRRTMSTIISANMTEPEIDVGHRCAAAGPAMTRIRQTMARRNIDSTAKP